MKETYKVKPPEYVSMGDPWYFEKYTGDELERLTLQQAIHPFYNAARVTIEENPCEDMPELTLLDMTLYIAPEKTIDTYLSGMMYEDEEVYEKIIGVDTAKYNFQINDRDADIYTGADGIWGSYTEYYRNVKGMKFVDAMVISLGFSSDMDTIDSIRERLKYFFEDVQQIENVPEPKIDESEDIANEPKI